MANEKKKLGVSTPSDREIRTERAFDAPRERVWRAHIEPELLAKWWGRGNRLTIEKYEAKRGGHWRFIEHGPDGEHGFEGRFREVTPTIRIAQTFEWDGMPGYPSINTATFEDLPGGRTKAVTLSLFFTKEERDGMMGSGMENGLGQSDDALEELLQR
jgi:uncharacterized protein YndB with AHSA1/START domain